MRSAIVLYMLVALCGCSQPETPKPASSADTPPTEQQACQDPRPQMCTMEYNPVCATRDTGIRCVTTPCPSSKTKTYASGCNACRDPMVISYSAGACSSEAHR